MGKVQRVSVCAAFSHTLGVSMTLPSIKAQGTLWSKGQKDYKRQIREDRCKIVSPGHGRAMHR